MLNEYNDLIERTINRAKNPLPINESCLRDVLEKIIKYGYLNAIVDFISTSLQISDGCLLDVGCGSCWSAPFFLGRGAKCYHGVDVMTDLSTRTILDYRAFSAGRYKEMYQELPVSLNDLLSCFPDIQIIKKHIREVELGGACYDHVVMLNVTEHLEQPREDLAHVASLMNTDGHILINHHNYYCWTGHHDQPQALAEYDPEDIPMGELADWNHVINLDFFDKKTSGLNLIRLHELLDILTTYFCIYRIEKIPPAPERGRNRMTPEIRKALAKYYDDELFTEMLRCWGTKPASKDLRPPHVQDVIPVNRISRIQSYRGHCFQVAIPLGVVATEFFLCEDDRPLGPGDSAGMEIIDNGRGRYLIWGRFLYFSTSDNSDPTANGRQYTLQRVNGSRQ
ncbi:MAG: methyltransferase domain-containing protein [Deltaproteobacteria bacterium]|nr:methyltransferase domain-containing protein [Deltaproteobacteria bacterium]